LEGGGVWVRGLGLLEWGLLLRFRADRLGIFVKFFLSPEKKGVLGPSFL
jgi:hypothetical protein